MLFARRDPRGLFRRAREILWPRSGFRRAAIYLGYRVVRLPGTPYSVAAGFAWGAAVSFTPLIGFHFLLAGVGAWLSRASIFASAIGTIVGNPWTFPLIWIWIYQCGAWILGQEGGNAPHIADLTRLFGYLWSNLGQYLQWAAGLKEMHEIAAGQESAAMADMARRIFWPMLVGAIPNALIAWVAFYLGLKYVVIAYRRARRLRRQERLAALAPEEPEVPNI